MSKIGTKERDAEDRFHRLYGEWLHLRAQGELGTDERDLPSDIRSQREAELARLICCTPAPACWMIHHKIEVLEHYLNFEDGMGWNDHRELTLLGGIKADLRVFEPGRASEA